MTLTNPSGSMRWTLIFLVLGHSVWAPLCSATESSEPPADDKKTQTAATDTATTDDDGEIRAPAEIIYERVMVVGSATAVERIPGSAHFLPPAELEKYHHSDVHRILRQVPGINIQEEDGFGLRPNLGMRGSGVERSSKITLMEDGVLIAPAPYAAPAAYYFPTAGRMEAVEVRKGSAAIKQGPFTTGGAINLLSTAIPSTPGGSLDLSLGDHRTVELHARGGGSWQRFAFQVETFQQETGGFKRLDGGGNTGFDVEDYLLKLRLNSDPGARIYQEAELKIGRTEQLGKETYLGLTRADFGATPYRRYAASQNDEIDTEHEQVQLRHFLRPSANLDLTTTVYRNDFFRNWYKNESTLGTSNGSILADPSSYSAELGFLRGDADSPDDTFALRNNRREYYSQGIQSVLGWRLEAAGAGHALEFGVRAHQDEEDRFQEDDLYSLRGGRLVLSTAGSPGSQSNRIGRAEALAFFVQDQISFGRWTLVPGVRFEHIETRRLDYGRGDPQRTGVDLAVRENTVDAVIPGIAVGYDVTPGWTAFAGVHRGFSPPSPSSRAPVEEEKSVNWELGTRYRGGGLDLELVGFFNDYDNLLGADTASSGGLGTGDLFNGGAAEIRGLEAGLSTGLAADGAVLAIPFRATYTYTAGEFRTSFLTAFEDWSPEVERGDALPYLPEHQLFAEIGLVRGGWSAFLAGSYVSETRTKAGQGAIPEDERVAGRLTFDLAASYEISDRYRLYLQVRNLLDETYVAARRPYGLRPGLPRTTSVGFSMSF